MSHAVRLPVLAILVALGMLFSMPAGCGSASKGKTSDAGKKKKKKKKPEPEKPKGPSPAVKALKEICELKVGDDIEPVYEALYSGYRRHLAEKAVALRKRLLEETKVPTPQELVRKKLQEIARNGGGGGNVNINIQQLIDEYKAEADKKFQAAFGAARSMVEDLPPDSLLQVWLQKFFEKEVRPDLSDRFLERELDLVDRVYLVYRGSKGRPLEFALMRERGRWTYAGPREERAVYMRGAERPLLFDMLGDSERTKSVETDIDDIQSALMAFRQDFERYPTGVEGLDALREPIVGADASRWDGPYAKHIYDPWGRRYRMLLPGKVNTGFVDLWSAGPDGKDNTADDIKNW